ncbi:SAM-dependent methyltransferase [Candidatus Gottesmanbacteria bacterium CG11_big_fil_rev_8_21_14_0_20_37_11]|uniref:SAM-dependent methyltransferase n=3 Tax=Candidatus Gottesmaniibacteriota TaxID=1752720 RepID=A0A2M7RS13_9BACT|nr:MAG: SAM-dependent methyltransferase [Candidatus Gottesmanbacteria bacterium CG1_02_37_22]PIP32702.1 MAG: SAM-dependent methyltransferase [Candidatus Gottesmanbacteria bacterium CG23_combo_of_CG06-09_8_20_14_all_37_19]PIR08179.1 MAG: SAM-dependent methyltransferase [Candidatus Gottesmanbacteria bacterium CG11_big_fil_rev_8_21_14_0_20_37_11]PIZ03111.1 MAG: SAM-dependent methyltransferase [Candidatus Gottesmanbacteria bacterium CG_4_10_14_0_8_um_filter_37_24]
MKINNVASSYRDPSGFVFKINKRILRQVNFNYRENYDFLMRSGLYNRLISNSLLVPHKEVTISQSQQAAYKILEPCLIPFISYPYEWCFSQLKDAALLTLQIQKISLSYNMSLKDASSFNIQFMSGKPIFIDTLSFEKYEEGKPWIAYRQFCEQFLAPLALSAYSDIRLIKLLQTHINGVPLDLAVKLLPLTSRLKLSLLLNIFLHARSYRSLTDKSLDKEKIRSFRKNSLLGLIESLEDGVKSLHIKRNKTVWSHYYTDKTCLNYNKKSLGEKKSIVNKYLSVLHPESLWDIGSNTGIFSRISEKIGIPTISIDNDPSVVEQNYLMTKQNGERNLLPLCIDIMNPTPAIGWGNKERDSFLSRPLPDTILALAIIHHLAISNNLSISKLSQFFAHLCSSLIIEFVPKEDKKVRLLLKNRADIFDDYNESKFEKEFSRFFTINQKSKIPESERVLYLMIKK